MPDIPPPAAAVPAAAADGAGLAAHGSPAGRTPAAGAGRERGRGPREPPSAFASASASPGCPTPGGAWSAAAPGRPGRPVRVGLGLGAAVGLGDYRW